MTVDTSPLAIAELLRLLAPCAEYTTVKPHLAITARAAAAVIERDGLRQMGKELAAAYVDKAFSLPIPPTWEERVERATTAIRDDGNGVGRSQAEAALRAAFPDLAPPIPRP